MKVGIITFHFVNNFGGVLQAYALQRTITEKCNATAEVIDYRNWFIRFTDAVRLFPITTNWGEIKSGWKTMKQRFGRVRKMNNFISRNCKLSRLYVNGAAIRHDLPVCDKYVCGSDQIWNPYITFGLAEPYFLGFVKDSQRKFSYAPSFGSSNKLLPNQAKKIKEYLSAFGDISVRENDGVMFVKTLTGRDVKQLIDPTFLLQKDEWNDIAIQPKVSGKYILLYIMQHDEEVYAYARKIKEKLGIQIVDISRYGHQPDFVDVSLIDLGPEEFISLFQKADYICTNSYHGLVFSLIFEKEFCLVPCKRFYARINNLLNLLHVEISDASLESENLSACYNKELVREMVAMEREKALQYLQKNIWGEGGKAR